jgi:hypothetical protein
MIDDRQQDDIDGVPLLAVLQVKRNDEANELWERAVDYERAIRRDPDFEGASQREIYEAIGKRLEDHIGADGVAAWLEEDAVPLPDEGHLDLLDGVPDDELEHTLVAAAEAGKLDELLERIVE